MPIPMSLLLSTFNILSLITVKWIYCFAEYFSCMTVTIMCVAEKLI